MTERAARGQAPGERQDLAEQWVGLLLAPAVFFAHLQITYVLVPWACLHHGDVWIHVSGVVSVLLAAASGYVAWRVWDRGGRDAPDEGGGGPPRARFMALVGVGMSAMFTLLLLAQWATAFFISPCQ